MMLGAPGLFLVTFLDSSFLSFPDVTELLLVWMVVEHRARTALYVVSALAGSIAGCLALFAVGKKGGEALVRSRFDTARVDRALASVRRHGLMAVVVPSLLPPPMPFKIFVLLAGVAEIRTMPFVLAIALGRGIRYGGVALLALRYGDRALEFIHANGRAASLALAAVALAGLTGYLVWTKAEARPG
jgi:membrane protein YqaA with SNARE-associated domain